MHERNVYDEFSTTVDVSIRRCDENDLPDLEWFGLFSEHREIIESAFARQERGDNVMLVAAANRFPIGQVWVDLVKRRERRCALLWAMRVLPPFRGQGIGGRLIRSAERAIRARGLPAVEVGVERDNPGARRFYERHGYRVIGSERESYQYTSPSGMPVTVPLDEWMLRKDLSRAQPQSRGHERAGPARDQMDDR